MTQQTLQQVTLTPEWIKNTSDDNRVMLEAFFRTVDLITKPVEGTVMLDDEGRIHAVNSPICPYWRAALCDCKSNCWG